MLLRLEWRAAAIEFNELNQQLVFDYGYFTHGEGNVVFYPKCYPGKGILMNFNFPRLLDLSR